MSALTQLSYRAPKSVGLIQGTPSYEELSNIPKLTDDVRVSTYSPDGKYFAFTQPNYVTILNPENGEVLNKIELNEVLDIHFSPKSSYILTWEKPIKDEASGNYHNNVKIFNIAENAEKIGEFSCKDQSGWKPDFTADEAILARLFKNEVKFFKLDDLNNFNKPWSVLKIENIKSMKLSPAAAKPTVAVFIPEKSGKPANVAVYPIDLETGNFNKPIATKSFFKAERCILKWNDLGTALLALASTDVDASNKSYYGETTLYLLGIIGGYDSRIQLDKEGPIHDVTWSPSSREFGVIYGFMPSSTTFFDSRGLSLYTLPPAPKNTILFSPHGKYILVAGFGNLQGTVDIYDRQQKFKKVSTFQAPNTSVCAWSPDGRYILTATTSPRLRVDNGIKIWYGNGKLIYNKDFKEVFQVTWRPRALNLFPPIRALDEDPEVHQSVTDLLAKKPVLSSSMSGGSDSKPKGAYRPPHQRGNPASAGAAPKSLYERELGSRPPPGLFKPGGADRVRVVPGAAKPVEKETKAAAKNRKKRENKEAAAAAAGTTPSEATQPSQPDNLVTGVTLEEKKIRGLLKKLRAIEQLKMKQANDEPLEDTQLLKIQTEDKVRADLATLGWSE